MRASAYAWRGSCPAADAPKLEDPELLTDLVRERLSRSVTEPYVGSDGALDLPVEFAASAGLFCRSQRTTG